MEAMRVITAAVLCSTAVALGAGDPNKSIYQIGACSGRTASSGDAMTCCDVTELNNKQCHYNTEWAMDSGVKLHPEWYDVYDVYNTSTFLDFQCALYLIDFDEAKQAVQGGFPAVSHDCPRPCSTTLRGDCAKPGASFLPPTTPTTTTPMIAACPLSVPIVSPSCICDSSMVCSLGMCCDGVMGCMQCTTAAPALAAAPAFKQAAPAFKAAPKEEDPSLTPWMVILIVMAVLVCLGATIFAFMHAKQKKNPSKAKRAVQMPSKHKDTPAPPSPPPADFVQPQPAYPTTAIPQMMQIVQPPSLTMLHPTQTTQILQPPSFIPQQQPQLTHILQPPSFIPQQQPQMRKIVQPPSFIPQQQLPQHMMQQMPIQTVATPLPVYANTAQPRNGTQGMYR